MKKYGIILIAILSFLSIFALGFNYEQNTDPNSFYQVYLDDQIIGTIKSEKELLKLIDSRGEYIKNKYNTDKVYEPNGLQIRKINTFTDEISSVEDVYIKIEEMRPFTVKGYQLTITKGETSTKYYALDEAVFSDALEEFTKIYVGELRYEQFMEDTQTPITSTGAVIEKLYFEENMTIKELNIPVTSTIYTDYKQLSSILLFGESAINQNYTVEQGDTIDTVSFKNQISTEEFLISNPQFTSSQSLLFPGQNVIISQTNPQISLVVEEHIVKDVVSNYKTEEVIDNNATVGSSKVIQQGSNGLERVTQKQRAVNGVINYVDPKGVEVLQPAINEIVSIGGKIIPNVGTTALGTWAWPTNSGYTISSDFAYRINPITGRRELHTGIDIAGTGHGSPVYAVNNGTVLKASYTYINGYYVEINHNNGYYTYYGHLSKFIVSPGEVVSKGQIIGYVGSTGYSTGPHLHFEVWQNGAPWKGTLISPWTLYR